MIDADKRILECCVDSVESAMIACQAGANRLELCANLLIGGTTPTLATFRQVRKMCEIPIHVLIRPRFGDFCYTEQEFAIIREEVRMFAAECADGVVIGVLTPPGGLDLDKMPLRVEDAKGMSVTLHRAFDMCADPYQTLEEAISLSISTILTSGCQNSALKGKQLLKALTEKSEGRIAIMAGGGVNADVIRELYRDCGIRTFHMSGKTTLKSSMQYRNENVSMGMPGFSEYELIRADGDVIRSAVEALNRNM
ncbi:MAG: copper homeostasis protein CutC [Lachnospiraceae bacterium]|nr:copper homeostasis protein CutC [Lachnospiraceae bacterium]